MADDLPHHRGDRVLGQPVHRHPDPLGPLPASTILRPNPRRGYAKFKVKVGKVWRTSPGSIRHAAFTGA